MRVADAPRLVSEFARDAVHAVRDELAGRRTWVRGGRAHVEARGIHHMDAPAEYVTSLEREVAALDGVNWAAVNGVLGDVIVDFDPGRTAIGDLRSVVERVEQAHDMSGRHRDRPMHPSDFEPFFDELVELVGDLIGSAVALAGRAVPKLSLPPEALAVVAAMDLLPELRRRLEARFGEVHVQLALSLAGAVLSAAAQAPLSALADAALRAVEVPAVLARRHAWERRAVDLASSRHLAEADPQPAPGARPVALPDGPVERYARRARTVTGVAAAALLPTTGVGNAARAVNVGAPRAARVGLDAYAAELGRILGTRGVVVRDPKPLKILDRIDTVVLDSAALTTGRYSVAEIFSAANGGDANKGDANEDHANEDEATNDATMTELRRQVQRLLNRDRPHDEVVYGTWRLAPLAHIDTAVPDELAARLRQSGYRPHATLGLTDGGRLVAAVALEAELDPLTDAVVASAHRVGQVIIAPISSGLAGRVGADDAVAGGSRLAASVRALQAEGHAVALISTRNDPALAAADCGIGVVTPGQRTPWAGDLLCGPGLTDAWLVLQACVTAKTCSNRSVRLAIVGSVAGALFALLGSGSSAGRRGALPVSAAALAGVGASVWSAKRLARRPVPLTADTTPWHAISTEQALRELHAVTSGLSDGEAAKRHNGADDGVAPEGLLEATVAELDNPLTGPLAAGAGLAAVTGSPIDAALVGAVMVGSAAVGAVQRIGADRAVRRLSSVVGLRARLRRQGHEDVTAAGNLVPGDIILLQAGDAVPADCRLIEGNHLEVDQSSLTGESMPVGKDPAPSPADALADRSSMLYAGSTVVVGTGLAMVVEVGRSTEAGRSLAIAEPREAPGGVEGRLRQLTAASVPVAAAGAAAVLGAGLLRGRLASSVSSSVALAVAAVPEGLPFAATVAQLSAARRLSRRKVLVRTPRTLEALGRVNVVCFDKTGTLTSGQIELRRVSDARTDEPIDTLTGDRRKVLATALRATPEPAGEAELPHPTDRAVAVAGNTAQVARDEGQPGWRMVQELPFEPGRGFHAVLGRTDGVHVISVKGAPEIVLPRCVARRDVKGSRRLTDAARLRLDRHVESLAEQGYRVLAVAERAASNRRELGSDRVERLEFLGLICLADTVRPTAAEALRKLRRAGVEVVMLTGDHPSTAAAIANELGIKAPTGVIVGPDLEPLDEAKMAEVAAEATVFARVSPAHKAAIVRALRRAGRTVAVTGDGANDAPAIRLADVGIAVGGKSAPAARQAADIVITDDRIETIVDAVIESRAMWRSVRDSVSLLLGGNLGEMGFTVGSSLLSANPPLNARQLLLVNLLTDLVPALVVAARPPRHVTPESLLREGPDAAVSEALARDIVARALGTMLGATGGWVAGRAVGGQSRARTVAFASLVTSQLTQTAASARGDPLVLAAAVGSLAVLFGIVQFPPTSVFFGCRPIGPLDWAVTMTAGVAAVVASTVVARRLELAANRASVSKAG